MAEIKIRYWKHQDKYDYMVVTNPGKKVVEEFMKKYEAYSTGKEIDSEGWTVTFKTED